ncbi:MAG: hypothetical protein HY717_16795 [Planctomycetes bacterium]|nr:hypothetical protein [Planctomycetota bacterium]
METPRERLLHLVVALPAEAHPLAERFRLKGLEGRGPWPVFEGEEMRLVVSGPGKVAAAAAASHLQGSFGAPKQIAWLNLGIGGCGDASLGEAFLAHKITDRASGKNYYPGLIFKPPCRTAVFLTVDQPEARYQGPEVYDMEASGFFEAACAFSTAELAHSLKIISDNRASPPQNVTRKQVEALIAARLEVIEAVIRQLLALGRELRSLHRDPAALEAFTERWRFTVTQERQLRRLLRQLQAIELKPEAARFSGCKAAGDVLSGLREELDSAAAREARG